MNKTLEFIQIILVIFWTFFSGCVLFYVDLVFDLLLVVQYYNEGKDGYLKLAIVVVIMVVQNLPAMCDFFYQMNNGLSIRMKLFDLFLNLIQAKVFVK